MFHIPSVTADVEEFAAARASALGRSTRRTAAIALLLTASSLAGQELPCSALFSDLNGDHVVNNQDFFLLADDFGQECLLDDDECSLSADFNNDGKINLQDVFMLFDQVGFICNPMPPAPQFDENRVLYLLADMQLGGPAGNIRLNPDDPNSVEAVGR